jgi:hypothetical protein
MKRLLTGLLGLDFIENIILKKVVRVIVTALCALAAKSKIGALVFTAFGWNGDMLTASLTALALGLAELYRTAAKDYPPPPLAPRP